MQNPILRKGGNAMKKKLLIFDVDGTVWDSERDVFLAFNHTLRTLAGFEITKEEFQKHFE